MDKVINVFLPQNISSKDLPLFEPFLSYRLSPLLIKNLKNVFVTYSGFCMDKDGLVKESHHDYPEKLIDFKNDADYFSRDVLINPGNLIELKNDNNYLLIHHPWFSNYYHWIFEGLLRLWLVREKSEGMILILPEIIKDFEFIGSSLEPFNFKSTFIIPNYKSLSVRNLCMPQVKPICDSYFPESINEIKSFFKNFAINNKKIKLNLGDRIYISRKKAQRRKVINEEELIPILLKHNFIILNNEDFTFWEQVAIYSNTKYLISIHGSGLTNMLFMKDNSSVLEFHKKRTNEKDWHSFSFWYLADTLKYKYYHQICEPTNCDDDYFNANFIVDIDLFERNIALMVS